MQVGLGCVPWEAACLVLAFPLALRGRVLHSTVIQPAISPGTSRSQHNRIATASPAAGITILFHLPITSLPRLRAHHRGALGRLQHFPAALDLVLAEPRNDALGDLTEVAGRQRQDGRPGPGKAHAQQARLRPGGHGLDDLGQPRDQRLPVRLVQLVLHRQIDELRVRRRLPERHGEERDSLEVERLPLVSCCLLIVEEGGYGLPHPAADTAPAAPRAPWLWGPRTRG